MLAVAYSCTSLVLLFIISGLFVSIRCRSMVGVMISLVCRSNRGSESWDGVRMCIIACWVYTVLYRFRSA